ncbi:hypothetical protein M0R89_20760 (plasmid) [Halorussus limi]|uniref:DUF8129 domain-containing protein n=1 Tax=Halorussus limi TaxID=2938695 RepID=A0A8U0I133_9EURY|nr:hypothetical protein [Halorussus limi]UPV76898.1 hypothetical protein M0R89_20760 [Halorussus limi]
MLYGELFVSALKGWRLFKVETANDGENDEFSPEKRLEAPNTHLIKAGIATIPDMYTLQECVAYENTHQNRIQILRRLKRRAEEIRLERA